MSKTVSITIAIKGTKNIISLKKCIQSLFSQTLKPLEINIVGEREELFNIDLFTSGNREILINKIYAVVDKNEARNIGILNAKGTYILYLDHDMVADKYLLEDCINQANKYEAIIIPEKGYGGNFWENCKKLERELIARDLYTVTPRFYKKSLFNKKEKPFDSNFGLLDEWGFSNKLMKKKIRLGYSTSFLLVSDNNFSVWNEMVNKFKRGLWMKNFYRRDKEDAWKRINPIKRGIFFYGRRLQYFIKEPELFLGLIILKSFDFLSFMMGYLVGYFINLEKNDKNKDLIQHYNNLKGDYLNQMYNNNLWTKYVDNQEKRIVLEHWKFNNNQAKNEKILDLGMGPGRWAKFFLDNHLGQVYGVDISPGMIEYAKKNIKSNKFTGIVAKMDDLPFNDKTFDRVFCFRAVKYAENVDNVFQEVNRVLKEDGIFLLEVSNNSLQNRLLKYIAFVTIILRGDSSYNSKWGYFQKAKFYSRNTITKLLLKQQFKILTISPLFILPSISLPTMGGMLTNLWIAVDNMLLRVLPKELFCRSWFVIAKNKG